MYKCTTFFLARPDELLDAFPGWKLPLATPAERVRPNPFTGGPMTVRTVEPLWDEEPPADAEAEQSDDDSDSGKSISYCEIHLQNFLRSRPRWSVKGLQGLDRNELAMVNEVVTSDDEAKITPALFAHPVTELKLEKFPAAFVEKLKLTNDVELRELAHNWATVMATSTYCYGVTRTSDDTLRLLMPLANLALQHQPGQEFYLLIERSLSPFQ